MSKNDIPINKFIARGAAIQARTPQHLSELPSYKDFNAWWSQKGVGMRREPSDVTESHTYRVAMQAWSAGMHKANQDLDEPGPGMAMRNYPPAMCPICNAEEVPSSTPRTVYGCGASDYDQRPGTRLNGSCTGIRPDLKRGDGVAWTGTCTKCSMENSLVPTWNPGPGTLLIQDRCVGCREKVMLSPPWPDDDREVLVRTGIERITEPEKEGGAGE